jgi:hypothetical protein
VGKTFITNLPLAKMTKENLKILIEENLEQILQDFKDDDTIEELHVYDFDDTLVRTDSAVYVVNCETGERLEVHPHEFHEYHLKPNETFDLSDFDNVEDPVLLPYFHKLKDDYEKLGRSKVAILTARPWPFGVHKFLSQHGMGDIVIRAIGFPNPTMDVRDMNAERKAAWLRQQLKKHPIKFMSFYDDNIANIEAAKELIEEFPNVVFNIQLVPI